MIEPTLETIPIAQIEVRPQVRRTFVDEGIAGLAASIRSVGLQHPILCHRRDATVVLIDGERRLRACTKLGWTSVRAMVLGEPMGVAEAMARQLSCNLQREDLNPLDRAQAIDALMREAKLSADEVARRLGKSPATITKYLAILKLPEAVRSQVADGQIPADAAYQLSRIADGQRQEALAGQVASGQLTRDALAAQLRKKAKASATARTAMVVGGGRTVTLAGRGWGREVTIDQLIECLEQLAARARKARTQGLSLPTFVRTLKDQASA